MPDLAFREAGYLFLATEQGLAILERNLALQTSLGADVALFDPSGLAARFPMAQHLDLTTGFSCVHALQSGRGMGLHGAAFPAPGFPG